MNMSPRKKKIFRRKEVRKNMDYKDFKSSVGVITLLYFRYSANSKA